MADEWLHPREAKPDGTVCHIQLRDALGPYLLPGRFFFHDDGYWYRIDPPRRIEGVVYRWRPADPPKAGGRRVVGQRPSASV